MWLRMICHDYVGWLSISLGVIFALDLIRQYVCACTAHAPKWISGWTQPPTSNHKVPGHVYWCVVWGNGKLGLVVQHNMIYVIQIYGIYQYVCTSIICITHIMHNMFSLCHI